MVEVNWPQVVVDWPLAVEDYWLGAENWQLVVVSWPLAVVESWPRVEADWLLEAEGTGLEGVIRAEGMTHCLAVVGSDPAFPELGFDIA